MKYAILCATLATVCLWMSCFLAYRAGAKRVDSTRHLIGEGVTITNVRVQNYDSTTGIRIEGAPDAAE